MIGSHNTFSYLTPVKWWMKLLTPWHKCQEFVAWGQLLHGVEYLDIRIRFLGSRPVLVHNNIIYEDQEDAKEQILGLVRAIRNLNSLRTKVFPVRLFLDVRKKPKDDVQQREKFLDFIKWMRQNHQVRRNLQLDEARIFWDWDHPIIRSKYQIKEIHTSVCSRWYQYILGTRWFAKKYNSLTYAKESLDKETVYLIDYVNIGN